VARQTSIPERTGTPLQSAPRLGRRRIHVVSAGMFEIRADEHLLVELHDGLHVRALVAVPALLAIAMMSIIPSGLRRCPTVIRQETAAGTPVGAGVCWGRTPSVRRH
jgi:hypothetical protein